MYYTNLLYHIVYGTKDRLPLITKELRPDLHKFLGGLVNDLHGTPLEINGVADHVHVLARIKPVISISEFLGKFKSVSSGWANRQTRGKFKWQVKYGAFTVSPSQVRDFRGAMAGRADKGIIVTTGTFTAEARREATRDGVPQIELIDGERLIEMLASLELGLKAVTTYEINAEFFKQFES